MLDELDAMGWVVTAIAVLITGVSKSSLGGAMGGLAVPFMAIWLSPRDALAVVLPILIAMDFAGMRAWRGKADWNELKHLVPASVVGIALAALLFGLMSDAFIKAGLGVIAVAFAADRLIRRSRPEVGLRALSWPWAWLCGSAAGVTSTFAHAGGPPLIIYLLGRGLPRQVFVATSVYFFTAINLAKVPFYIGLDMFSRETLLMSAVYLPLVPVGVWIGTRLLAIISERTFFYIATGMLGLSGLKLLWDVWGSGLAL